MNIKILGSGCKKCMALAENAKAAAKTVGVNVQIEKVTDIVAIARYGVMSTPGLVIDETLVGSGRVLNVSQIVDIMRDAQKA